MKRFLIAWLLALCTIFSATSVQAYPTLNDKPNVAVMKIKNKVALSKEINEILAQNGNIGDTSRVSEFLIKSLEKTHRFHLVEREGSFQIAEEFEYIQSGMVDTSDASQIGKQKAAHYLILGSLTQLSAKESGASTKGEGPIKISGNVVVSKFTVTADVIFRFVNVETGEIVLSVDGRGSSAVYNTKLKIDAKEQEVYEADNSDSSSNPTPQEGTSVSLATYEVEIGGKKVRVDQVENAIKKAISDAIKNKKYGLLAELNGTAEGERF